MTDTRMTFKDMSNKVNDDSAVKLRPLNYPHGWYAGTGYSPYIDEFYHLASRSMISSSDHYLSAMAQVIHEPVQDDHRVPDILRSTCLRTYINEDHIDLEIFFINQSTGMTCAYTYPKDQLLVLFPGDYTSEMQTSLKQKYQIEELHRNKFEKNIAKLLKIFEEISINSNAVSDICEIRILKKDGPIK